MTERERFAGFVEHVERYAGECTGAEAPTVDGANRGFAIAFFEDADEPSTTTVTNGLRFQRLAVSMPEELACTVRREQTEAARHLLDFTGRLMLSRGQGLEWGTVLRNDTAVLVGTQIYGLIAGPHPYFDDGFDELRDEAGVAELRVVTLVPATPAELVLAQEQDAHALYAIWAEQQTDLADVTRASAV